MVGLLANEIYEYLMTVKNDEKNKLIGFLSQFDDTDKLIELISESG